ncbi:MAG: hypothetical protein IPN47_14570 [Gemmatimonadetes bacterium]|nr:hypothetical protein [Gemmatimonadota bacterium]
MHLQQRALVILSLSVAVGGFTNHPLHHRSVPESGRRVVALDPRTGRKAWAFGSAGSGPGEFGGVAFVSARQSGGALVLDHANQRVTLLSESGAQLTHRSYPLGASATGVCDLDSSQIRFGMTPDREIERVSTDSTRVVSSLPWPELRGQPSLVRESHVFSHPCVFRSIPIPRFGRSRSPISLEADHPFRSKSITRFARSRSPVSADGDHSVT